MSHDWNCITVEFRQVKMKLLLLWLGIIQVIVVTLAREGTSTSTPAEEPNQRLADKKNYTGQLFC